MMTKTKVVPARKKASGMVKHIRQPDRHVGIRCQRLVLGQQHTAAVARKGTA